VRWDEKEMKYRWPSPSSDWNMKKAIGTFSLSCFGLLHMKIGAGCLDYHKFSPTKKKAERKRLTGGRLKIKERLSLFRCEKKKLVSMGMFKPFGYKDREENAGENGAKTIT
jgi:hypothetical protein